MSIYAKHLTEMNSVFVVQRQWYMAAQDESGDWNDMFQFASYETAWALWNSVRGTDNGSRWRLIKRVATEELIAME